MGKLDQDSFEYISLVFEREEKYKTKTTTKACKHYYWEFRVQRQLKRKLLHNWAVAGVSFRVDQPMQEEEAQEEEEEEFEELEQSRSSSSLPSSNYDFN